MQKKIMLLNSQIINFVMVLMFGFQKFNNIINMISIHSFQLLSRKSHGN